MILSTAYLPPLWYFEKIYSADSFCIDLHEHFIKQTIRNRCFILSPQGVQSLIIPIVHNNRTKTPIKDILIANDHEWQRQHWRSLNACYRRSAFFEFYMDDIAPFYHKKYLFLHDFNFELLQLTLRFMKLKRESALTESYESPGSNLTNDFRVLSNFGVPQETGSEKKYPQVFTYNNGFTGGLSAVDLLFNMGPAAVNYLQP